MTERCERCGLRHGIWIDYLKMRLCLICQRQVERDIEVRRWEEKG
jgi:hypothetical protein